MSQLIKTYNSKERLCKVQKDIHTGYIEITFLKEFIGREDVDILLDRIEAIEIGNALIEAAKE